jgi:transposase
MTIVGPVDGAVFLTYLRCVLGPKLRPGDILMMDNLGVHHMAEVAAVLGQLPAPPQLHYLPAYSPDLNPIEHCWSKLKTALRAAAARTHRQLQRALRAALPTVTHHDAVGWFRHCGYGLQ